ncbi:MAG TPA: FKBP-type peptidyl-prolyl cis-trans isomerase [Solirubrobacteraceae bacterium]|nr:FKBP-type peptidyl-prolyl cis-trans isomerase [Solirubrobacteraceae bacterium]
MLKRTLTISAAVAVAVGIAACGGSTAPGVQLAPGGGGTQAAVPTTPTVPAQLSTKPVVQVPSSCSNTQLVTKDLIPGTGQVAQAGQSVTVNYVGVLCRTGKEFDSSWKRNQPFTTTLTSGAGGVIAGWVKGIPGMRVGGRRELIIPASLAYGKTGSPPTIPPNSPLVFVVDLLSVG